MTTSIGITKIKYSNPLVYVVAVKAQKPPKWKITFYKSSIEKKFLLQYSELLYYKTKLYKFI